MNQAERKLRLLVSGLDIPALEALSSKGLVRRAQKDLERGVSIRIDSEQNGSVTFVVGEFRVTIPEAGPAKARCSCSSSVVCQHVLAAMLFLQSEPPPGGTDDHRLAEEELLSYSREQLEAWAGKSVFRAALKVASQCSVEWAAERGMVISFPAINARCHYAPGAGLDGIIVSGSVKDSKRLAAAAVIAFQKSKGVCWELPISAASALEESPGAPRSRSDVLDAAQQVFNELIENGLTRLSSSAQQRLETLAVAALGVNLPRLSLALRGLSSECALVMTRAASADLDRMLTAMAGAYALCDALRQGGTEPRPDLVGWRRTEYESLGNLDLMGVSAWPWRTASGYKGLTLLFWDVTGKRWSSWTESRPAHQEQGFHPIARYRQPGPWEGAESPRELARGSFRLMNARRNSTDRLSSSNKSRVVMTGVANITEHGVPVFSDWTKLSQLFDSRQIVGLKEPKPLDTMFAVRPSGWGQRVFDPVAQIFSWPMLDVHGEIMPIEIGFDLFSEPAIKFLESAATASVEGAIVVGRVQKSLRHLSLRAYSIHLPDREMIHLFLDTISSVSAHDGADHGEEDDGPEEEQIDTATIIPAIDRLLDELEEALLVLAEAGIASLNPTRLERFARIAVHLERVGLRGLASAVTDLTVRRQPSRVLRCAYMVGLHRRAMIPVSSA